MPKDYLKTRKCLIRTCVAQVTNDLLIDKEHFQWTFYWAPQLYSLLTTLATSVFSRVPSVEPAKSLNAREISLMLNERQLPDATTWRF